MSKLNLTQRVPVGYDASRITDLFRDIQEQVNALSEGFVIASYTAQTSIPTVGSWNKGDFVRNSSTSEAGSASSKYVVIGWICTVGGSPGTWLPCRVLTGN